MLLLKVSKLTFHTPLKWITSENLRLDRQRIRQTVEFNQIWLVPKKSAMYGFVLYDGVSLCRNCGRFEETADHLLFDCEELSGVRRTTLGALVGEHPLTKFFLLLADGLHRHLSGALVYQ